MMPPARLALFFSVLVWGCAGVQPVAPTDARPVANVDSRVKTVDPISSMVRAEPVSASARRLPVHDSMFAQDLGPDVLMPRAAPDDAVVMKVGGFSIRKSHLYDRLFELDPVGTKRDVDLIVFDILLAEQARKNKIFVDAGMIDKIVKDAERRLEEKVKQDWGAAMSLDRFLVDNRGIDLKTYRTLSRRRLAREMFRTYIVRYLAGLEDRVRIRIISHRDRPTIETILKKARQGAEFRSLALRESEHPTQVNGGALPPFSRTSKAKYVKPAFALKAGEISEILSVESDGVTHFYLLYCVQHIKGRKLSFKEVKAELDEDRLQNPLTEAEALELYDRLRTASELLHNGGKNR
jgi:PPIC-type PPIASE domain